MFLVWLKILQPTIAKSVGDVITRVGGWPQVCLCGCVFFFLIQLHFFRISLTEGKQMDAAEVCGKNMTNVTGRRRFKPGKCPDRNGDIMYGSPLWVYASLCGLRAVTTWVKRARCSNKLTASLAVVARSVVASASFRDCRKSDEVVNTVVVFPKWKLDANNAGAVMTAQMTDELRRWR